MAIYGVKTCICIFLYVFVVKAYTPEEYNIAMSGEEVCAVFVGITVILFLSERIKAYMIKKSFYAGGWLYFVLTPFVGFYIIESPYNINLDQMSLKFVSGNILFLAFFLVLFYCLINSIYISKLLGELTLISIVFL